MELLSIDIPLWTILLPIALYLLYRRATRTFDTWSKQGVRGPKPLPVLGTMLGLLKEKSFSKIDPQLVKNYGDKIGLFMGTQPQLGVADPEFLRIAMIKEFSSCPNRAKVDVDPLVNHFMTSLRDDHWKHVRSTLSPTFTTGKLKQMRLLVEKPTQRFVERLTEQEGKEILIKKMCGAFTMDVISSTAFGLDVDSQSDADCEILQYVARLTRSPDQKKTFAQKVREMFGFLVFVITPSGLLKYVVKVIPIMDNSALQYFNALTDQIMENEKTNPSTSLAKRNFIQMCLDQIVEAKPGDPDTRIDYGGSAWSTKGLTKLDVTANAVLFFLAGNETTASSLQYIFFELAHHPEIQQRLYEDIKEHCSSEYPTYEELSKLTYADWIIDETLRLYPPAPRFDRYVERDMNVQGIFIPEGSSIQAMAYAIHHNPEYWPDPHQFDPERFSPANKDGRHPCAWMPFGIGNRNCIGMRLALLEIKAVIAAVLWSFELKTTAETLSRPVLEFAPNFSSSPKTPISLTVTRRKED